MNTREFITKAFNGETRATHCASVFSEGNGTDRVAIYSYGYHYPLLFKVAGKTIRNVAGYSVTTAKHIGHTYQIPAIDVPLPRTFRLTGYRNDEPLAEIIEAQTAHVASIKAEMASKKRQDTKVYADLAGRLYHAQVALDLLTN